MDSSQSLDEKIKIDNSYPTDI